MRRIVLFHVVLDTLLLAMPLSAQLPDSTDVQLQAAMQKETIDGDLKGAIAIYKEVIAAAKGNWMR